MQARELERAVVRQVRTLVRRDGHGERKVTKRNRQTTTPRLALVSKGRLHARHVVAPSSLDRQNMASPPPAPLAPPSIPIGTLIKSRWKVIRKIGQGAFGTLLAVHVRVPSHGPSIAQ